MDTLTHGLLGLCVGALPVPRRLGPEGPQATRAGLLVGVLAAELPDVDYLWPSADPVLNTLQAHRGLTHALVAAPLVALVAVGLTWLVFRRARLMPLYLRALLAVPLVHLLPDLWTGWGTRLFLPFSAERLALDWTMVVDPLFTAPLLVGALWAARRRVVWRRALLVGAGVATAYLLMRVALLAHLTSVVERHHPTASEVRVFPAALSVLRWRYVVTDDESYRAGEITWARGPLEQARMPARTASRLAPDLAAQPTVREALDWARFPVVTVETVPGGRRVRIADLRYHLRGQPTLAFEVTVDAGGRVSKARLDRGGSARDLWRRWRTRDAR